MSQDEQEYKNYRDGLAFSEQLRKMFHSHHPIEGINNDMHNYDSKNFENKEKGEWDDLKAPLMETMRVTIRLKKNCIRQDGKVQFNFEEKIVIGEHLDFVFDVYVKNKDYKEAFNIALGKLKLDQLEKIIL